MPQLPCFFYYRILKDGRRNLKNAKEITRQKWKTYAPKKQKKFKILKTNSMKTSRRQEKHSVFKKKIFRGKLKQLGFVFSVFYYKENAVVLPRANVYMCMHEDVCKELKVTVNYKMELIHFLIYRTTITSWFLVFVKRRLH